MKFFTIIRNRFMTNLLICVLDMTRFLSPSEWKEVWNQCGIMKQITNIVSGLTLFGCVAEHHVWLAPKCPNLNIHALIKSRSIKLVLHDLHKMLTPLTINFSTTLLMCITWHKLLIKMIAISFNSISLLVNLIEYFVHHPKVQKPSENNKLHQKYIICPKNLNDDPSTRLQTQIRLV